MRRGFVDPPRHHSLTPIWVWIGSPKRERLVAQLDEMLGLGISAAVIMPAPPFAPGFLSDEHLSLLAGVADAASERDFRLWLSADYSFPTGDGRVISPEGPRSLVIERDPEARMRRLALERGASGGLSTDSADVVVSVAVTLDADGRLQADDCRVVRAGALPRDSGQQIWRYRLVDSIGVDGGLVDLMRAGTADTLAEVVLTPLLDAVGDHAGETVVGVFADHEGSYGTAIAWTSDLFERFATEHGYRLEPVLPLLPFDDPEGHGARVRRDYVHTVGALYAANFFQRLTDWCAMRGLTFSSHVFEESHQLITAHVGDLLGVQRALGIPGFDSLFNWGLRPRHAKEAQSVAATRGVELLVENQACLGIDGYRDFEQLRLGTSALATWGCSRFMPFLVSSAPEMVALQPSGSEQPWWHHFKNYADLARRHSFVNASTDVLVGIALFHPREHFAAESWPLYEPNVLKRQHFDSTDVGTAPEDIFRKIIGGFEWHTPVDADNDEWGAIQDALVEAQRDFLVVDGTDLRGRMLDGVVHLGAAAATILVLPPMTWISQEDLAAIRALHASGGTVVAVGRLPHRSLDSTDDQVIGDAVRELFDQPRTILVATAAGLPDALTSHTPALRLDPPNDAVRIAHRACEGGEIFAISNLADDTQNISFTLAGTTLPSALEGWRPEDGTVFEIASYGDLFRLSLGPGELVYVAASSGTALPAPEPVRLIRRLPSTWQFEPLANVIPQRRLVRREAASIDAGEALGWHAADYNDRYWGQSVLGPEALAERAWGVTGPYENWDWRGLTTTYPPELDEESAEIAWSVYESPAPWVNLDRALGTETGVGMFDRGAVAYARGVLVAERARTIQLRLVVDTCADVWVGGTHVFRSWEHKQFVEPTEAFTHHVTLDLAAGATPILVKVGRLKRAFLGGMGFMLRLSDEDGAPLEDVRLVPGADGEPGATPEGVSWYRTVAPPGSTAFSVPSAACAVYRRGQLHHAAEEIDCDPGDSLAFVVPQAHILHQPVTFRVAPTPITLGSWSRTPFHDFVGTARYHLSVDLSEDDVAAIDSIDCGLVGVVAEVRVNSRPLGVAVWRPFRFSVGDALQVGHNDIEIDITNTTAPLREAIPEFRVWNVPNTGSALSKNLERTGLIGPVTLMGRRKMDR